MTFKSKLLRNILMPVALLAAQSAYAGGVIVVISPNGDPTSKKAEAIDTIKLLAKSTMAGETSYVLDGIEGKTVATFHVPEGKAYNKSEKARVQANRAAIGRIMKFTKEADTRGQAGLLDIPGSLRTTFKSFDMDEIDAIIFFGNPLLDNPREPALSMAGGHVPSPKHITVSASQSHLGMGDYKGALKGTSLHISTEGYDWAQNTGHQDAVEKFYHLTAKQLGSNLVTFNADRDVLLTRVLDGVDTPILTYDAPQSDKLEMVYAGIPDRDVVPINKRELSQKRLTASEISNARTVEVGVTWDCACDVDIYVRPHNRADILYYGHQRSREGEFRKDYRDAADLLNGLETVSFTAPVDLSKMAIGINFYGGNTPETVTGEIRLALGNQTYAKSFTIKAKSGNQGGGAAQAFKTLKAPSNHWVMMPATDIVKPYIKSGS